MNDRYPLSRVPCGGGGGGGGLPSFYRLRRGRFTSMPHYLATCDGMAYSAVEFTIVLANLPLVMASWCALCLNRATSRVEAWWLTGASPDGLEGAVDNDPYGVQ
jgi:hypothetical protein